jgi:hypothetical protein
MTSQLPSDIAMEAKIERIRDDLSRLDGHVNGRLGPESIAKILLVFWGVLSVGFAVFGIRSLNDIKSNVKLVTQSEIDGYVLQQKQSLEALRDSIESATKDRDEFLNVHADQMNLLLHLREVSNEVIASDLEGRVDRLILEAASRASPQGSAIEFLTYSPGITEEQRVEILASTTLDPAWRSGAMGTLTRLDELLTSGANFDSNKLFNVTQVARQIGAFETSNRLADHLVRRYATPAYQAVVLNSRIRIAKDSEEVEAGFSALMALVSTLGPQEPHIVLSEAWNGAEYLRRYADFVAAIERLERGSEVAPAASAQLPTTLPSYAYVIKAQALLRESRPGSVERARAEMTNAANALRKESTHSQWYPSTVSEGRKVMQLIASSSKLGADSFSGGDEGSGELAIEELLKVLSAARQAQDAVADPTDVPLP